MLIFININTIINFVFVFLGHWICQKSLKKSLFMNLFHVPCKLVLARKSFVTNSTLVWFFPFMNWSDVIFKHVISTIAFTTSFTLKWLVSLMNWWNMPVKVTLIVKNSLAVKNALEKSIMNCLNMLIQSTVPRKSFNTVVTFENSFIEMPLILMGLRWAVNLQLL